LLIRCSNFNFTICSSI